MQPEVQHIALQLADDSVAVMQFVTKQQRRDKDPGWKREASDEAIGAEIAKSGLPVRQWVRVRPSELPDARADREAWRLVDGKVIVCTRAKARLADAPAPLPTTPLPDDMAAHLNAFNQRVEQRLAEVSRDMAAVKGSDDSGARLEALEIQFAVLMDTFKGLKR